jgi:hypothetical protein
VIDFHDIYPKPNSKPIRLGEQSEQNQRMPMVQLQKKERKKERRPDFGADLCENMMGCPNTSASSWHLYKK